ncbi:hypothetical protein SESBI_27905 [Sesbania bispinosa]|nr:hypothetical protein SESBI_27905 [Sesbania bispinosa]
MREGEATLEDHGGHSCATEERVRRGGVLLSGCLRPCAVIPGRVSQLREWDGGADRHPLEAGEGFTAPTAAAGDDHGRDGMRKGVVIWWRRGTQRRW